MIRRAEEKDIGALTKLLFQVQKVHSDGRPDIFKAGKRKYTDEELLRIIGDDGRPIFVYDEDGAVSGYVFCIKQYTSETEQLCRRSTLYIDDLCVDKSRRGQHIGKALYEYVLDYAKKEKFDSVTLNVWALNESAYGFYVKMGLAPLKTMMEKRL